MVAEPGPIRLFPSSENFKSPDLIRKEQLVSLPSPSFNSIFLLFSVTLMGLFDPCNPTYTIVLVDDSTSFVLGVGVTITFSLIGIFNKSTRIL